MRVSFAPAFCFLPKQPPSFFTTLFFFVMGGVIGITSDFSTSVDCSAALLHFFKEHMVDSLFKQSPVFRLRPGFI